MSPTELTHLLTTLHSHPHGTALLHRKHGPVDFNGRKAQGVIVHYATQRHITNPLIVLAKTINDLKGNNTHGA